MKSTKLVSFIGALCALAAAGYASPAQAASDEYVSIILDQTGSMLTPSGAKNAEGEYTSNRWLESIKSAKSAISGNSKATTIAYGIWGFKQNATQNGPAQIWPLVDTDCFTRTNFESVTSTTTGQVSHFCKTTPAQFAQLTGKLDSIGTQAGQVPQDDWLTPLADSLCGMMENISTSNVTAKKTFLFESDAGENVSSMTCLGVNDTLAPAALTYQTTATTEWGMDIDSWQAKVFRKLYRFNQGLTNGAVTKDGAQVRLPSIDKATYDSALAAYNIAWNVDIHYELYPPAQMMAMQLVAPSASAQLAPQVITDRNLNTLLQPPPAASLFFSTQAAAAPLAAGSGTPSIGLGELNFFKALGKSTPRSKYREIVTDPNVVYGVNHKLKGDVDDSGCTDQADLNIIKQQDVWLQRAVLPLQIAIRADVTRDGWVDQADKNLVVSKWGQGCINPVRPPVL
jgi:hypothetical protein